MSINSSPRSTACILILLAASTTALAEPPQYRVVEFPLVDGEYRFTADKINDQGVIIGRYFDGAAFGYKPAVLINGTYHTLPDGSQTEAFHMTALNNQSIIVGWEEETMPMGQGFATNGKTFLQLGTLGGAYSYALGINNRNTIVGYSTVGTPEDNVSSAFIWSAGIMKKLTPLSDGYSYARAVNDHDNAVGFSWDEDWHSRAVLWPADGSGPVQLTTGENPTFPETAVDINQADQIVGDVATDDPDSFVHAFIWEENVLTDIGVLPEAGRQGPYGPELTQTRARAINDRGQVVGNSEPHFPDPDFDTRPGPFFYEDGEIFNLNDYLYANTSIDLQVDWPVDINNHGVILATVREAGTFKHRSIMLVPKRK